jgi:3-oxoacyl-[acyl-carrier-protein] synthase-3
VAINVRVLAVGSYAPRRILSNSDLEHMVDTSDEWITTRTGIKERHIAAAEEATSDLAYEASTVALERAGLAAQDIDLILVATSFPDMPVPSTACLLQNRLGVAGNIAFDLQAACSGFVYGLHTARAFLTSGLHRTALVVGAEVLSRILDWTDRRTCVLVGDGAGAVVLRAEELLGDRPTTGVLSSHLGADGSNWELIHIPAGGSRLPASEETVRQGLHYYRMQGAETYKYATRLMGEACEMALREAGLSLHDVDFLIPHQANLRIMAAAARRLDVPMDRVVVAVDHYGNTSNASIPIALDEAMQDGRVGPGTTAVLVAFGGGATWGAAVVRF